MVKSSKSKSGRKQSKKTASCCVSNCECNEKMWNRMNRNAVAWSIGLLIGAVIIVDIPSFRETFKSNCGNGLDANSVSSQCDNCDCSSGDDNKNNADLAQFNRGMPLSRQGEATEQMEESMNAGKMYRLLLLVAVIFLGVYVFNSIA